MAAHLAAGNRRRLDRRKHPAQPSPPGQWGEVEEQRGVLGMEAGRTRRDAERLGGLDMERLPGVGNRRDLHRLGGVRAMAMRVGGAVVLEDAGQQRGDRQQGDQGSGERGGRSVGARHLRQARR